MEAVVELSDYEREPHRRTGGKPMPTLNHAYLQSNLLVELNIRYRKTHTFLSELNITMPERPDAVPDIAIYPKLQPNFLHDITSMTEMPLTVIEIISPSHRGAGRSNDEILAKFERYFNAGVKSCWLVLPSLQAIALYSAIGKYKFFTEDATLVDPITAIELPLGEIFS